MNASPQFTFLDPGELRDGLLWLSLDAKYPADPIKQLVPSYHFSIRLNGVAESVGYIDFRAIQTEKLTYVGGYLGYEILEKYRGQRLAERSCRLLLPFIGRHGFKELWVTCNPGNTASRKTLERVGACLVDIVDVPPDSDMYALGERQKCRYRIDLSESTA